VVPPRPNSSATFDSVVKVKNPVNYYWLAFTTNMLGFNFRRTAFFFLVLRYYCSKLTLIIMSDMLDWSFGEGAGPDEGKLLDHQPLRLNNDDYERVQQIPVKKVGGLVAFVPSFVVFSPSETIISLSYDREPTSAT
jgi:hypothetical protein